MSVKAFNPPSKSRQHARRMFKVAAVSFTQGLAATLGSAAGAVLLYWISSR